MNRMAIVGSSNFLTYALSTFLWLRKIDVATIIKDDSKNKFKQAS